MPELISTTWGELGELFDGPHATPQRLDQGSYFLNIASLNSGRLDLAKSDHVSREDFVRWTRRVTPQEDDLLFSYETRLGEAALMPAGVSACLGRRMALLRPDQSVVVPRFLLYYFLSPLFQKVIQERAIRGATVDRIGLATMPSWPVTIPSLPTQKAIAEVLGAIDDKIFANARQIDLAQELSVALVADALAGGARQTTVAEIAQFHNRRRVPLSSRERELRRGVIPYYGAAGQAGTIDEPIFDEVLVLVGEDGSVITPDELPVVQYIWGPSWVNNHAHVLTGSAVSTELLRIVLGNHKVAHLVTGAVQPKLSMGSLKRLEVAIPVQSDKVDELIQPLAAVGRGLADESARLVATRDELLPLLISGQVTVRGAERVAGSVT